MQWAQRIVAARRDPHLAKELHLWPAKFLEDTAVLALLPGKQPSLILRLDRSDNPDMLGLKSKRCGEAT